MIVLDQSRLSFFLDEIAKGFQKTPFEMVISLVAIFLFLCIPVVLFRFQRVKIKKSRIAYAQKTFNQIVDKLQLDTSDQELIALLTSQLPAGSEKKHLLVKRADVFNRAARSLIEKHAVPQEKITALRIRLGFNIVTEGKLLHSSAELPEDIRIELVQGKGKEHNGIVVGQDPQSLVVQLEAGESRPIAGRSVRIYFQRRHGLYSFESWILSVKKGEIRIAHSEKIDRVQNRKFFRKNTAILVEVSRTESNELPVYSTLMDLGGGGASLSNPQKKFRIGDRIDVDLQIPDAQKISIAGEVIRVSRGGNRIHIAFDTIKEHMRDKIIGFVLGK